MMTLKHLRDELDLQLQQILQLHSKIEWKAFLVHHQDQISKRHMGAIIRCPRSFAMNYSFMVDPEFWLLPVWRSACFRICIDPSELEEQHM